MRREPSSSTVVLGTFRRRWPVILLGALLLGSLAAVQFRRTPTLYRAEATLFYRFGREYNPVTPTEVRRNWGENIIVPLETALATEMHLLMLDSVAVATLDAVVDAYPAPSPGDSSPPGQEGNQIVASVHAVMEAFSAPSPGEMSPSEVEVSRIAAFHDALEVQLVQGATMLRVELEHTDAEVASRLLFVFLAAYQQRRDALFYGDFEAYYASRSEDFVQEERNTRRELVRLQAHYDTIESGSLTEMSSSDPAGRNGRAGGTRAVEVQATLATLADRVSALEDHLLVIRDRRVDLDQELADWEGSKAYREQVAPNVEIADRPRVAKVTSSFLARILSGGITGAILVWAALALGALLRSRSASPAVSR